MLPERINVMKIASYDVQSILEDMGEAQYPEDKTLDEITIDDLLEWITPWVREDFDENLDRLIFQNENGEEL